MGAVADLRHRLSARVPRARIARFALYLAGVIGFLYLVKAVLPTFSRRSGLDSWIALFSFALAILGLLLLLRWIRLRFMWRLRNRLIVTYIFIGVIPLVLVLLMAVVAGYLFAGQFATFLVTNDLQSELKSLQAANSTVAGELVALLRRRSGSSIPSALEGFRPDDPRLASTEIVGWYAGRPLEMHRPPWRKGLPTAQPAWLQNEFSGVVRDNNALYLRVVNTVGSGSSKVTVISTTPVDHELLQRMAAGRAQITIYLTSAVAMGEIQDGPGQKGISVKVGDHPNPNPQRVPNLVGGALGPKSHLFDREVGFFAPLPIVHWDTGASDAHILQVTTRLSALYAQLFLNMVKMGDIIYGLLIGIAIAFAVIELIALFIGVGITRTITRSVAELYEATRHINRGHFRHRIAVQSSDQLASLEQSFNSMTESLERLMAEQKEKQRLENELAIAQEVQAQLFPRSLSPLESLEVHGVCQPARTVSGDYYDFLPMGPDRLAIAVGDISGKGISAALLMATLHSAVRAYEFGRVPALAAHLVAAGGASAGSSRVFEVTPASNSRALTPAEVLSLLNRHLYRSTPPEKYATLFLATYEGKSRSLTYSNAGHLPPILISQDGAVRRLDTPGLVIGLFDDQAYEDRRIELRPGEIFLAFSDGITEPENEFGEFGEERLLEIVRTHRHQPLARISELVTAAVHDWIGGGEQPDDVTLVLARAR